MALGRVVADPTAWQAKTVLLATLTDPSSVRNR